MTAIISAVGLKENQIIVESQQYDCLPVFAAKGYNVSYYLPELYKMEKDSLEKVVKNISLALRRYPSMFISSGYRDYHLMNQYFPEKTKLLWWRGNKESFWNWKNRVRLSKILSDGTVKVFLVPFRSKKGER